MAGTDATVASLMGTRVFDTFLPVANGHIFVRRWTSDRVDRPPILLLHDSLGSVEQWRDFPAALAETARTPVIAYDRLGFGRSTALPQRPSAEFIREEAVAIFPALKRALGLTRFTLFGHSVGGVMALVIAGRQGEDCAALITESAQAFIEPRTLAAIRAAKARFDAPAEFARLTRWHGEKARWVLEAWTEIWLSASFRSWSLDEDLPRVKCPVLVLHGEDDQYGSAEFPRRIAANVSGDSELAILERCGHVPHREQRSEVLRRVGAFLARSVAAHSAHEPRQDRA
jgi:pimeloyl-ACP methyl ester carboxylesterase